MYHIIIVVIIGYMCIFSVGFMNEYSLDDSRTCATPHLSFYSPGVCVKHIGCSCVVWCNVWYTPGPLSSLWPCRDRHPLLYYSYLLICRRKCVDASTIARENKFIHNTQQSYALPINPILFVFRGFPFY